jgi:alkylhydroperoxidase family enzyme
MRYADLKHRLEDNVLSTPGQASPALRRAAFARAAYLGGGTARTDDGVPAPLASYVEKVARHAYRVTDDDVAALLRAGSSEDAVFEITVATALGAALGRLERGLAALRGEEPD